RPARAPQPPLAVTLEQLAQPQKQPPPAGTVAYFSCAAETRGYVHATKPHGVFCHFVIQGLLGEADENNDHQITLEELHQYVTRQVQQYTHQEYKLNQQQPVLVGQARQSIVLAKPNESLELFRQGNALLEEGSTLWEAKKYDAAKDKFTAGQAAFDKV